METISNITIVDVNTNEPKKSKKSKKTKKSKKIQSDNSINNNIITNTNNNQINRIVSSLPSPPPSPTYTIISSIDLCQSNQIHTHICKNSSDAILSRFDSVIKSEINQIQLDGCVYMLCLNIVEQFTGSQETTNFFASLSGSLVDVTVYEYFISACISTKPIYDKFSFRVIGTTKPNLMFYYNGITQLGFELIRSHSI